MTNYFTPIKSGQWDRQIDAVLVGDMVTASVRVVRNTNTVTLAPWFQDDIWIAPAWLAPRPRQIETLTFDMHFIMFNNATNVANGANIGMEVRPNGDSSGKLLSTVISIRTTGSATFSAGSTWITGSMSWPIVTRS